MQRRFYIRVCRGATCAGLRDGDAVHARLAELLAARGLDAAVALERQSCFGRCWYGPNVHVGERLPPELPAAEPPPRKLSAFYSGVRPDDAVEIVAEHLLAGRVVERLLYRAPALAPLAGAGTLPPAGASVPLRDEPAAEPAACKDPQPSADVGRDPR